MINRNAIVETGHGGELASSGIITCIKKHHHLIWTKTSVSRLQQIPYLFAELSSSASYNRLLQHHFSHDKVMVVPFPVLVPQDSRLIFMPPHVALTH